MVRSLEIERQILANPHRPEPRTPDAPLQVDLADALEIADEDGIGREQCAMMLAIAY